MAIDTETTDAQTIERPASTGPRAVYHLAGARGGLRPAVTLGQGLPGKVNGLPAFYFWKDAIVVGSYVHPAGTFSLDVTRDRIDGYVGNFSRMKSNGVGVPILMDHAPTASATLGWIVGVKRDGDRLMELHQFLGESARDTGLRNQVSLGIDPDFVDGRGIRYGEAIVHSAVTPVPVVPGQGGFEPVESSEAGNVVTLSLARVIESSRNEPVIEDKTPPAPPVVATPDAAAAVAAMEQVIAMKREIALSRGGVDPAVAAGLYDLLTKPALHLSRTDAGLSTVAAVFDLLARNRPVATGEATGLQVLSRLTPGDDGGELRDRMIALASGAG